MTAGAVARIQYDYDYDITYILYQVKPLSKLNLRPHKG